MVVVPHAGAWRQQQNHTSTTGGAAAGEGCPAAEPPAVRLKASVRVRDEGGNSGGPDPGLGFKEAGFSTSAGLPRGGARAPGRAASEAGLGPPAALSTTLSLLLARGHLRPGQLLPGTGQYCWPGEALGPRGS